MTTKQYKELVPEHSHLSGDDLWDAMTLYMVAHPELQEKIPEPKSTDAMPYKDMGIFFPTGSKGEFEIKHRK